MRNKPMLEDMVLFPEDSPQVINLSFSDLDDEPMEVNNSAIRALDNVDDDVFEFGTALEDSVSNESEEAKRDAKCAERGYLGEIMTLITDEQEAINGYNNFLSAISLEELITPEVEEKIKNVISDIIKEENKHVGQLMEIQKLFNPYGNEIEKGAVEGQEQLAETKVPAPTKSLFEEIRQATFVDPKYAKPEDTNGADANPDTEDVCTLADTDDEF